MHTDTTQADTETETQIDAETQTHADPNSSTNTSKPVQAAVLTAPEVLSGRKNMPYVKGRSA